MEALALMEMVMVVVMGARGDDVSRLDAPVHWLWDYHMEITMATLTLIPPTQGHHTKCRNSPDTLDNTLPSNVSETTSFTSFVILVIILDMPRRTEQGKRLH